MKTYVVKYVGKYLCLIRAQTNIDALERISYLYRYEIRCGTIDPCKFIIGEAQTIQ